MPKHAGTRLRSARSDFEITDEELSWDEHSSWDEDASWDDPQNDQQDDPNLAPEAYDDLDADAPWDDAFGDDGGFGEETNEGGVDPSEAEFDAAERPFAAHATHSRSAQVKPRPSPRALARRVVVVAALMGALALLVGAVKQSGEKPKRTAGSQTSTTLAVATVAGSGAPEAPEQSTGTTPASGKAASTAPRRKNRSAARRPAARRTNRSAARRPAARRTNRSAARRPTAQRPAARRKDRPAARRPAARRTPARRIASQPSRAAAAPTRPANANPPAAAPATAPTAPAPSPADQEFGIEP